MLVGLCVVLIGHQLLDGNFGKENGPICIGLRILGSKLSICGSILESHQEPSSLSSFLIL